MSDQTLAQKVAGVLRLSMPGPTPAFPWAVLVITTQAMPSRLPVQRYVRYYATRRQALRAAHREFSRQCRAAPGPGSVHMKVYPTSYSPRWRDRTARAHLLRRAARVNFTLS